MTAKNPSKQRIKSSIVSSFFSGDVYLSLGISLSFSFETISEFYYCEFFETLVILLEILLPIKSPVASAVFWITLFGIVLSASVADCLAWSRIFWHIRSETLAAWANTPGLYLLLKVLLIFYQYFYPYFLAIEKNP